MNLSDNVKELLILTKPSIQRNDFDGAYDYVNDISQTYKSVGGYTTALMSAGVRPEKYLKTIPNGYMWFYEDENLDLVIPNNIKIINTSAFYHAKLRSVTIQNKGAFVSILAFSMFKGKIICSELVKQLIEESSSQLDDVEFEEL